jgi:ubiquinone/menaquinone biosynthesis C-methylase UbiE
MKQTIDNFSNIAAEYALFRPGSPDEIFDFLYSRLSHYNAAWDCGTGNGQVAVKLAQKFATVYATDISNEQLQHAQKKDNIIYRQERAESTTLKDGSIDLVTIGQAIHWFDFDPFYKEVKRVAAPGALIAAWTYNLINITAAVDDIIYHFYFDIIYDYWDKERKLVESGYSTIPFPFEEIQAPLFQISKMYNVKQLIGYLGTWSAVKHYMEKEGKDPVLMIEKELVRAWGNTEEQKVFWPVHMRVGRVG